MIIVIEGADDTGKTTLAQWFVKQGFAYQHTGKPEPGEDVFATYTKRLIEARGKDVVFDRLHVGEIVYGTIMRGNSGLSLEQLRLLNRLLFAEGGLIIFCLAPFERIQEHWQQRLDREYVQDAVKLRHINDAYGRLCRDEITPSNAIVYNFTENLGQANAFAEGVLNRNQSLCPNGVIGSPTAQYIFIGEKSNGPYDVAFHSDKRASNFLNTCLWDAGYLEPEMAFTNALMMNGQARDLRRIYEGWCSRKFIALGRVAQRVCLGQGVPHLPVEHPAYVKRFLGRRRKSYVGKLRNFRTGAL